MSMTEAMQMSGGFEEFMEKTSWGQGKGVRLMGVPGLSSRSKSTVSIPCQ